MSEQWLVRVDTGGTFTDGWARSPDGREQRCKVLSNGSLRGRITAANGLECRVEGFESFSPDFFRGWQTPWGSVEASREGVLKLGIPSSALGEMLEIATGEEAPVVAARVLTGTFFADAFPSMDLRVATTRGTNALLEGKGTPPLLFVTRGFRDLLEIRDQRRPELFARAIRKGEPVTRDVVETSGRRSVQGEVLEAFNEEGFRAAGEQQFALGHRVAVVAFLQSDRFSADELVAMRILREIGFEEVTASHQLAPRMGYLSRMETAVANGYLAPVMNSFKRRVAEVGGVSFLTSAGGMQGAPDYEPVDSLLSGPAGGLVGALAVAKSAGFRRVLTFDMGGTSTDVARLEGEIGYRYEQAIGPVKVRRPGVRMETVAAGGGSICRWHNGGLEVGPHSAGAEPGPACYGQGGPLTVTDVNLLLGNFDESQMEIPLDRRAAETRLAELCDTMRSAGADVPAEDVLLRGLRAIAIERMAEAMRAISVGEGFEPSDYTLVAFGGAGPQHACELAESLGMGKVLVPGDAGLLSAWGLHRAVRESLAERQVLSSFQDLEKGWVALGESLQSEALVGVSDGVLSRWLAEVRLWGQESVLEVTSVDFPSLRELRDAFAQQYESVFGYRYPSESELELVMLRAIATEDGEAFREETFGEAVAVEGLVSSNYCTLIAGEGWKLREGSCRSILLEKSYHAGAAAERVSATGAIAAELMRARFESIAESMGELLRRTALSTNVKERLDFSCALLDGAGRLVVNAPHIPVHLGALGVCVRRVSEGRTWRKGDTVVVNHPGFGGSHLPDVTLVSPIFGQANQVVAFVANRAHHSEIGGKAPGSMPGDARNLAEEGVVIAPFLIFQEGRENFEGIGEILRDADYPSRAIAENLADMRAQCAANQAGVRSVTSLLAEFGEQEVCDGMRDLFKRASHLMGQKLEADGKWRASDALDDGTPIELLITCRDGHLTLDFAGTAARHPGNLNATGGVTRSAVLYALRLWVDEDLPLNEGLLEQVTVRAEGTFLDPVFVEEASGCPAVVGGNVETSQRICELILRAFGICAESQGTMNNFLFGNREFGYYETIGGGSGAGPHGDGASGVHVHMTNTAITDPEVLEYRFPVRLRQFSLRRESGGGGECVGGDGLVREVEFLEDMEVTFLTQHRSSGPRGLAGGQDGLAGRQQIFREGGWEALPGIVTQTVHAGERVRIETPGGGGFGPESG